MKHFVTLQDYTKGEIENLIDVAIDIKKRGIIKKIPGKKLAMIFFNSSLRTRTSFELGMNMLGGHAVNLEVGKGMWALEYEENVVMNEDKVEHIKDAAKVISRYADAIAIRSFAKMNNYENDKKDSVINAFKKYSDKPIINMESANFHPCQALADIMTIKEQFGSFKGKKFVLSWAYHPKALPMAVPNSAIIAASKMGLDVTLACPKEYLLDDDILNSVKKNCALNNSKFSVTSDVNQGYKDADIIYAKSWGSKLYYGELLEEKNIRDNFKHWIVNEKKMSLTNNAKFMHCLPIRRNVIATDSVIDSQNSVIYDQAENRMHVQNALLLKLLGEQI